MIGYLTVVRIQQIFWPPGGDNGKSTSHLDENRIGLPTIHADFQICVPNYARSDDRQVVQNEHSRPSFTLDFGLTTVLPCC